MLNRDGYNNGCITVVAESIISVLPSGAAAASVSSAGRLPAPGRFSTTMFCASRSPSRCAMPREMVSMLPPAAVPTMMRMGRFCWPWACGGIAASSMPSKP